MESQFYYSNGLMGPLPYHLASSSFADDTATGFDFGGGFLEKSATTLNVAELEFVGADRAGLVTLSGLPSTFDAPREAGAVAAAREAIDPNPKSDRYR